MREGAKRQTGIRTMTMTLNENCKTVTAAAGMKLGSGAQFFLGPLDWAEFEGSEEHKRFLADGGRVKLGPFEVEVHKSVAWR